jgi:hypothetical protein
MAKVEPQKSEVHDATDDAATSPAATREPQGGAEKLHAPQGEVRPASVHLNDATIIRDDTDDGGPLVIKTDDPDLNPPRVPVDPFPTDATPEIDPPVEK